MEPAKEKIKVYGTKEGALYIKVSELFAIKDFQEWIFKLQKMNITKRKRDSNSLTQEI